MLLADVALRLCLSADEHSIWLVLVPGGTEHVVAAELRDQILAQGGSARIGDDDETRTNAIVLFVLESDAVPSWPARLDAERSRLVKGHTVAFIIAEPHAGQFLRDAPHVASFIGKRVVSTSAEDDEAPAEQVERRLQSLREAYGMTDEQARQAFESGSSSDAHLLEWMILLGDEDEEGTGA